jgi:hypothetical protein
MFVSSYAGLVFILFRDAYLYIYVIINKSRIAAAFVLQSLQHCGFYQTIESKL